MRYYYSNFEYLSKRNWRYFFSYRAHFKTTTTTNSVVQKRQFFQLFILIATTQKEKNMLKMMKSSEWINLIFGNSIFNIYASYSFILRIWNLDSKNKSFLYQVHTQWLIDYLLLLFCMKKLAKEMESINGFPLVQDTFESDRSLHHRTENLPIFLEHTFRKHLFELRFSRLKFNETLNYRRVRHSTKSKEDFCQY